MGPLIQVGPSPGLDERVGLLARSRWRARSETDSMLQLRYSTDVGLRVTGAGNPKTMLQDLPAPHRWESPKRSGRAATG